jgi:hypothetical protein
MRRREPGLHEPVEAFPFPADLVFEHPWRAAADDAAHAYRAWCEAPLAERAGAYAAYRAAEEREAAGAEDLRMHETGERRARESG